MRRGMSTRIALQEKPFRLETQAIRLVKGNSCP